MLEEKDLITENVSSQNLDKEELKIFIQDTISRTISDKFKEIDDKLDKIIDLLYDPQRSPRINDW